MQPCLTCQALERVCERVRVQEGAVTALVDEGDRLPSLVERVVPTWPKRAAVLKLFSSVSSDPIEREGRQPDEPIGPLGIERRKHDPVPLSDNGMRCMPRRMKFVPVWRSTSSQEMPRISERRAPVTVPSRSGTSQSVSLEVSNRPAS
jgi:hypothetical protein